MTDLAEAPASSPHTFRISLNLTRRIVRRLIEQGTDPVRPQPWGPKKSSVPDSTSFRMSVRVLKRSLRRMIDMAECLATPGPCPCPVLIPVRSPAYRG